MKYRLFLILSIVILTQNPVSAEPPWRIVSASDWHSAEGGVLSSDPHAFEKNQASERRLIAGIVAMKPDVVIIAGDMGSGHWTTGALRKAGVLQPGETLEAAIHRLGAKTYRTLRENFAAAGVKRLWVCIGDHGLGDNDWPPGSERALRALSSGDLRPILQYDRWAVALAGNGLRRACPAARHGL